MELKGWARAEPAKRRMVMAAGARGDLAARM
jgi:hypothetical protein